MMEAKPHVAIAQVGSCDGHAALEQRLHFGSARIFEGDLAELAFRFVIVVGGSEGRAKENKGGYSDEQFT